LDFVFIECSKNSRECAEMFFKGGEKAKTVVGINTDIFPEVPQKAITVFIKKFYSEVFSKDSNIS
jgi:hypothetical protein